MVVVLAAVLAYRRHLQNKQRDEQEGTHGNNTDDPLPESFPGVTEASILQRAGSITKAALGCTTKDTTVVESQEGRNSTRSRHHQSSGCSARHFHPSSKQHRKRRRENKMSAPNNGVSMQNGSTEHGSTSNHASMENGSSPTKNASMTMENNSSSLLRKDVFVPWIRQEWINAVFGEDFYSEKDDYTPPRRGTGLSGIPDYVTYSVTIPPPLPDDDLSGEKKKVGITLSKLALGVYAKKVEPGSEAHAAGVREGSILISLNQMGMLAEPSKQALERLWQYEGHFASTTTTTTTTTDSTSPPVLALKFIKDGKLYTSVCLSKPPLGISWAPCVNLALVQRSYGYAQAAGVKRGCLVASIGVTSLRDGLNHEGAASLLSSRFESRQEIQMTCAYTPAASRTGHYERTHSAKQKGKPSSSPKQSLEGVQVRVHPLEYSIGSFLFQNPQPPPKQPPQPATVPCGVSQLAARVANGELEAPTGKSRSNRQAAASMTCTTTYGPCPMLSNLLEEWHTMDGLVFLLKAYGASFQHDTLFGQASEEWSMVQPNNGLPRILFSTNVQPHIMVGALLLPFVSILCISNTILESDNDKERSRREFDAAARNTRALAEFLLQMASGNLEFCQCFYFLLRSYTAALDLLLLHQEPQGNQKLDHKETGLHSHPQACSSRFGLLQTLDLLQWTQKQLSKQLQDLYNDQHNRVLMEEKEETQNESDGKPQPGASETSNDGSSASPKADIVATCSKGSDVSDGPKKNGKKKKKKSMMRVFSKRASSKKVSKEGESRSTQQAIVSEKKKPSSPQKSALSPTGGSIQPPPPPPTPARALLPATQPVRKQSLSASTLFQNMSTFLGELDGICDAIELSLVKSFSQKIADWALQPWSPTKETALAKVTEVMREGLRQAAASSSVTKMPLINPMDSTELLTSVDSSECYILPSAHFPLLLTFNTQAQQPKLFSEAQALDTVLKEERIYRTRVEIVALRGSVTPSVAKSNGKEAHSYFVQGAIAGSVKESGRSLCTDGSKTHVWDKNNVMTFDTRSSWGTPRTLSLRLSSVQVDGGGQDKLAHTDDRGRLHYSSMVGSCWVDLGPMWNRLESMKEKKGAGFSTVTCHAQMLSLDDTEPFDQHGELSHGPAPVADRLELELRVTTEILEFDHAASGFQSRKRMLLYKHDDDLRQDMFAIQFIKICDGILKASGLDMKLLTFGCMPVGAKRGFIEWVPGSVPFSDICVPPGTLGSSSADDDSRASGSNRDGKDERSLSEIAKAGLTKYQYFRQCGKGEPPGSLTNNPIQEYLRSVAYDSDAPYLIRKEVMDTFVKSCAGYCVITYLLGVGDRHLDNLLLHQSGHFFHCDYSFILGNDPKKYLPMRITEDMVHGMGGHDSDNYAMFLSLAGAAFVTFRRHENVRVLLSLVRLMAPSALPDVSVNRSAQDVLLAMRDRLRLDLTDGQAISYMEQLIETSISSKMWAAVDAIHSLGKRF